MKRAVSRSFGDVHGSIAMMRQEGVFFKHTSEGKDLVRKSR